MTTMADTEGFRDSVAFCIFQMSGIPGCGLMKREDDYCDLEVIKDAVTFAIEWAGDDADSIVSATEKFEWLVEQNIYHHYEYVDGVDESGTEISVVLLHIYDESEAMHYAMRSNSTPITTGPRTALLSADWT
jgi:hypothetical protein